MSLYEVVTSAIYVSLRMWVSHAALPSSLLAIRLLYALVPSKERQAVVQNFEPQFNTDAVEANSVESRYCSQSAGPTMGASSVSNGAVVALAVFAAGLVVFPGPVADYVRGQQNGKDSFWTLPNLLRIAHVTSFATTFGMQFWVSFIGGVIMFKNLPRHQFGNLQSRMFPVYFKLAAVSLACNISILSVLHPLASSTLWETLQIGALGLSLLLTLTNLLVLEPITTKLMRERHKAEKEDGISTEPGVNRKKEIEKASPKLRAINKKFGALHGISSLINLFAFWGLLVHVAYLASRLSL